MMLASRPIDAVESYQLCERRSDMTVDKALLLAGTVVFCVLIIASSIFWMAAMVNDMGGSWATLALVLATLISIILVGTTAAMAHYAYRLLTRQPDQVSLDEKGRRPVYREHIHGAVLYEDTGAISGAALVIHPPDQTPPCVRCEPEGISQAGWQRLFAMPDTLEVFEGSLKDSFDQNRGDGKE
jgi:hypothetical protein